MKNIKIIKKKEADKYFLRNIHSYNDNLFDQKIVTPKIKIEKNSLLKKFKKLF